MTWNKLKQQAIADFKSGKLGLLALGILLACLDSLENSGLSADEVISKAKGVKNGSNHSSTTSPHYGGI
jgi:hypothetical protein